MIARRGFLAGCLAVVASPLAMFRRKPVDEGPYLTLDQIDEFVEMNTRRFDREYLDSKCSAEICAEIDRLAKEKQQDFFDHVFDVGGRQGVSSAS